MANAPVARTQSEMSGPTHFGAYARSNSTRNLMLPEVLNAGSDPTVAEFLYLL